MAKRPRYDEGLRRREGGGAFFVPDLANVDDHAQPRSAAPQRREDPDAGAGSAASRDETIGVRPATAPVAGAHEDAVTHPAPSAPTPATHAGSTGVPFVRAADLPPLTPRRTDGRAGRTVNVKPVLIGLVDDAYRRAAAAVRANVDKSAFYEALWIVGLRHYDEVQAALARDPAGERLVAAYAAEAARDDA